MTTKAVPVKSVLTGLLALTVLAAGAGLLALRAADPRAPGRPPVAVAEPSSRRVVAEPGARAVHVTYRLSNEGGRDLVLGEVSTTCGCSVASIEPKVLRPGQAGVVRVEGHPPEVGQKDVQITIATNEPAPGRLTLRLVMVGTRRVPYVTLDSGAVQFGEVRADPKPEPFFVETMEPAGRGPWITRVTSSVPGLVIRGRLEKEDPAGAGAVHRRYGYTAALARRPAVGALTGEVLFLAGSEDPAPVLRLPVRGSVRPPVFAVPASLYATLAPSERPPRLTLTLRASDPDFRLDAEPAPDNPGSVEVRRVSREGGRNVFEVSLRDEARGPLRARLAFATNHPEAERVEVPLTVSPSNP